MPLYVPADAQQMGGRLAAAATTTSAAAWCAANLRGFRRLGAARSPPGRAGESRIPALRAAQCCTTPQLSVCHAVLRCDAVSPTAPACVSIPTPPHYVPHDLHHYLPPPSGAAAWVTGGMAAMRIPTAAVESAGGPALSASSLAAPSPPGPAGELVGRRGLGMWALCARGARVRVVWTKRVTGGAKRQVFGAGGGAREAGSTWQGRQVNPTPWLGTMPAMLPRSCVAEGQKGCYEDADCCSGACLKPAIVSWLPGDQEPSFTCGQACLPACLLRLAAIYSVQPNACMHCTAAQRLQQPSCCCVPAGWAAPVPALAETACCLALPGAPAVIPSCAVCVLAGAILVDPLSALKTESAAQAPASPSGQNPAPTCACAGALIGGRLPVAHSWLAGCLVSCSCGGCQHAAAGIWHIMWHNNLTSPQRPGAQATCPSGPDCPGLPACLPACLPEGLWGLAQVVASATATARPVHVWMVGAPFPSPSPPASSAEGR